MSKMMPKQFIKKVLIDEIGEIHKKYSYLSFAVMAIGIEFLGKSLNKYEDWNKTGKSEIDFKFAINNLNSFQNYRRLLDEPFKLYDSLRNGFAHSFVPKKGLSLSSGNLETKHFVIKNNGTQINLRCEDFYNDFKGACEEVISMTSFKSKKMDRPLLSIPNV